MMVLLPVHGIYKTRALFRQASSEINGILLLLSEVAKNKNVLFSLNVFAVTRSVSLKLLYII